MAAMGLRDPGGGHHYNSGSRIQPVACDALHACFKNIADFGTLGRYSAEDGYRTQFNGSVLLVPSYRTCVLLSLIKLLTKIRQIGYLVASFMSGVAIQIVSFSGSTGDTVWYQSENLSKSSTFFLT